MTKMMKESVKTGHPTGLPEKLLQLFAPNPPLEFMKENCKQKRPSAVGWSGVGQYLGQFAVPGDEEYEPKGAGDFPEERMVNNREYALQVRLDEETKREKYVGLSLLPLVEAVTCVTAAAVLHRKLCTADNPCDCKAQLITHVTAFAVAQGEALAGMEAGQGRHAVQRHVCSGSASDGVCCMRSSACT